MAAEMESANICNMNSWRHEEAIKNQYQNGQEVEQNLSIARVAHQEQRERQIGMLQEQSTAMSMTILPRSLGLQPRLHSASLCNHQG